MTHNLKKIKKLKSREELPVNDMYESIIEISTLPICYLANTKENDLFKKWDIKIVKNAAKDYALAEN